jgi:phage terminase Nu1 subunit (DNA packaging protein)
LVLENSKQLTQRQWAAVFGVRLRTIECWRSQGMLLDLWSAPTSKQWHALKADALRCLWGDINFLEDNLSR